MSVGFDGCRKFNILVSFVEFIESNVYVFLASYVGNVVVFVIAMGVVLASL